MRAARKRRWSPRNPSLVRERMRTLWIESFTSAYASYTVDQMQMVRDAMADLAADDAYWQKIARVCELQLQIKETIGKK